MLHNDLTGALRHVTRRPLLAFAVATALAVSIGVSTIAFAVTTAVLWKPLPFEDASKLVFVWEEVDRDGERQPARVTGFRYAQWSQGQPSIFSSIALFGAAGFTLDSGDGAESIRGVRVSAGYFDTLGIKPVIGRTFVAADEIPGQNRVVILSHGFWRERFGGSPSVIGRTLGLGGERYMVLGVMPPAVYPGWPVNPAAVTINAESQQLWVPIPRTPQLDQSSSAHVFGVLARLASGVTPAQARDVLNRATDSSAPDAHGARISPLREQFVGDARNPLIALLGATLAVLLVACANLASLFVSAFEARRSEFAVRAAMGATLPRLLRQLALETLVSTLAGAVVGVAMARAVVIQLPSHLPPSIPLLTPPVVDWTAASFAAALAGFAALLLTAWPATRLARFAPLPRGVPPRTGAVVYRALVISQVALALVLSTAAALLARSLDSVERVDPGFVTDKVLVADVALPVTGRGDPRRLAVQEQEVLAAAASAPRVAGVAAAYDHPLEANWSETPRVLGDLTAPEQRREAELRIVSPSYFDVMGVEILAGRALTERDDLSAPGAALVNEAFARELGGARVLGRRIQSSAPRFTYGEVAAQEFAIVGMVENERSRGIEAPPRAAVYLSTRQFPQSGFTLLARTSVDPLATVADVKTAIHAADRAITFSRPTSLSRILAEQLAERRMTTTLMGGFAGVAVMLCMVGLYGLLAVFVVSQTRDIGVRLALGAPPRAMAWRVLREAAFCALTGIAIGSVLALATGRLIASLLVGVAATDPVTMGTVAATLLAVALGAACAPAARALSVDPVIALRAE